jgi:hypothetical protein
MGVQHMAEWSKEITSLIEKAKSLLTGQKADGSEAVGEEAYILERTAYRGSGYDITLLRVEEGKQPVRIMGLGFQTDGNGLSAYVRADALMLLDPSKQHAHVGKVDDRLLAADAKQMLEQFEKVLPNGKDTRSFSLQEFAKSDLGKFAQSSATESIAKNDVYVKSSSEQKAADAGRTQVKVVNSQRFNLDYTEISFVAENGKKLKISADDKGKVAIEDDSTLDYTKKPLKEMTNKKLAGEIRNAAEAALKDGRFSVTEANGLEALACKATGALCTDKSKAR